MLEGLSGGIIVALVDFVMVFLILGGLMLAIRGLKKVVDTFEKPPTIAEPQVQTAVVEPTPTTSAPKSETDSTQGEHPPETDVEVEEKSQGFIARLFGVVINFFSRLFMLNTDG